MVLTPTSETGISISLRRLCCRSNGFSLLELLVVIAIIGLLAGAAVLSIGVLGDGEETEREALRLQAILELLREEAVMQSRDYGILFSATGYRFYIYDHQMLAWVESKNEKFLLEHKLRIPLKISLALDGRDLVLDESFEEKAFQPREPHVLILSSGEITPFEADLHRELSSQRYVLTAELDGTLDIFRDGP